MKVQRYSSEGEEDLYLLKPTPEEVEPLVRLLRDHGSQRGLGAAGVSLSETGELVVYARDYRIIVRVVQAGAHEPLTVEGLLLYRDPDPI